MAAPAASSESEVEASSLLVAVFDEEGLEYLGQYDLSLGARVNYESEYYGRSAVYPARWRYYHNTGITFAWE